MSPLFVFIVYWVVLLALIFGATFGARVLLKRFGLPTYVSALAAPGLYLLWNAGFLLVDLDRLALFRVGFFQKAVLSNLLWLSAAGLVSYLIQRYFER